MRLSLVAPTLLLAALACAAPPRQDPLLRPQVCLNGQWQFQPADVDLTFPPRGSWDPVPIRIPSPWNVNSFSRGDGGDFNCFPSYPKAWEEVKAAWHRRTFAVPATMRDKAIFLRFEAVHYWADVYVNGKKAGSHEGGFTPFELNVMGLVKVGAPNELLVGVKAHQLFDVNGRATYGWGSFWGGHIHGIWQDVTLLARPPVHVSDVFVQTSVQRHEITVEVTVQNLSDRARSVRLQTSAEAARDVGKPGAHVAKVLPLTRVFLRPGQARTVTLTEPWEDPVLWWPYDAGHGRKPHLYVLTTSLTERGAQEGPLDVKVTRFGFREFGLGPDKRKFQLNGVTFSGRGDAWHFMGVPELTPDYARAWYGMAMSAHVNIIRLHAQVYPEYYMDVADEMGMLIVDESALWGSAINFWYNPDFLRRAHQHVQELVLRDRNHPSVAVWSVANEIYARQGNDNAPSQDWIFARYAELAKAMKTLDPSREVCSDGDGDLNGRLNIFSFHYPGPDDPHMGKPCTIGESGSMFYSTPPEVSPTIGDRAYRTSNDRMEALGVEMSDLIEGYRKWAAYAMVFNLAWYGLEPLPMDVKFRYDDLTTPGVKPERLGPYCTMLNAGRDPKLPPFKPNPLYYAVRDAFTPIRFFIKERSDALWGGQKATRHFTVHNDVLYPSDLTLRWQFTAAGQAPQTGSLHLDMQPGEMREVAISFTPRAVTRTEEQSPPPLGHLTVILARGGDQCYRGQWEYLMYRPPAPDDPPLFWFSEKTVALYDPRGATADVLAWAHVGFTRVASVGELLQSKADLWVIGANSGVTPAEALRIDDAAPGLVVFEGNPGFYGDAFYCSRHPQTYRRAWHWSWPFGEPGKWVSFWGRDGVVARAGLGREIHGSVRREIVGGDGDALMLLARNGDRPRVFTELALVENARQEPEAWLYIRRALLWASPDDRGGLRAWPARVIAAPRSRFTASMTALGVSSSERSPHTLLCDASRPPADPKAIRTFMAASNPGQNLVLVGLTPESLPAWNALLAVKLSLKPSDAVQLIRGSDEHWPEGRYTNVVSMDNRDLFWIEEGNTRRIMDYAVSCNAKGAMPLLVTNHTDWRRWCWQGENTKTAAIIRSEREPFTPQTGLLETPCGARRLIVSQVRLDPMNPKSVRFYSQLLTDLSVPLRRGKASDLDMTPFNMDADGFLNAWLVCGPFDGASAHQKDFVGGEGKMRPEVGTLSGPCVWRAVRSDGPVLDFTRPDLFGKRDNCAVYAATYVKAPRAMTANLWLGSDDGVKVWLNGAPIHDNPAVRPCEPDSDKVPGVKLTEGWNLLLFKVDQVAGNWGLCARLVDDRGRGLESLLVSPTGGEVKREAIARQGWRATASDYGESAQNAIDGDSATRWTTGRPQAPGQWLQVDLGRTETVSKIVLDSAGSAGDWPRGFRIQALSPGGAWRTVADCPDAAAAQQGGVLTLVIPPTPLRALRITQTAPAGAAGGLYWSVHELTLSQ